MKQGGLRHCVMPRRYTDHLLARTQGALSILHGKLGPQVETILPLTPHFPQRRAEARDEQGPSQLGSSVAGMHTCKTHM